jgi:hypothetical protein
MKALRENPRVSPRYILIGVVVAALLCLVLILFYNIFTGGGEDVASNTPTPVPTETEEGPEVIVTPEEADETPTPTRVISNQPTESAETPATAEPTTEPTTEPTIEPTTEPAGAASPTRPATSVASTDLSNVSEVVEPRIDDLVENGDFEEGFNDQGIALQWQSFKNDSVIAAFSAEQPGPYVKSGDSAQRISLAEATQPDRYAGIYQTVKVIPNQRYGLELNGQIRTGFGDIEHSSYGYRMQYAIDPSGGTDWRDIPAEDWVELPWDEQLLNTPNVEFLKYTTVITPTSDELTIFVRAWNKWPDPGLAEYTLDSIGLVGPVPGSMIGTQEALVDGGLPTTGIGDPGSFIGDGRFWGAVVILLLLAAGAIYRGKWGY